MAQATVQVKKVFADPFTSKAGKDMTRYAVLDHRGNRYQTISDPIGAKAQAAEGSTVTITYDESDYNGTTQFNIKSLVPIEEMSLGEISTAVQGETNGNGSQAVASHNHSSKDEQIARAVAFKGAIDLASGGVLDPDVETILGVTEAFYSYLTTGQLEPETADTRH